MIVAIDGPAGAGKSTVTRRLAQRLGFQYLDTGAMYRAVTLAALARKLDLSNQSELAKLACQLSVRIDGDQVFLDEKNVSAEIREPCVTRNVGAIADAVLVREHLVNLQRQIASRDNYVCEGRDQGTVAFPDAFCKIFLTASEHDRAMRRFEQLQQAGQQPDFRAVLEDQKIRDERDRNRPVGRLQQAVDAVVVETDGKSIDEVVEELLAIVNSKL